MGALTLLFMIIYAFAIILTQAVTEHTEGGTRIEDDDLIKYYGDLPRSMMSLWMAVSDGLNWHYLTQPLAQVGDGIWVGVFMVYIAFVYFAVLNVVTGVFCQNAIESAQHDMEMLIESQSKAKNDYVDRLKMLFKEMHIAANDTLSAAEFKYHLERPKVQSWFRSLEVDVSHAWKLYALLDTDGSGLIHVDEFVEGCLKLRGSATRIDVESLKLEVKLMRQSSQQTADFLEERFSELYSMLLTSDLRHPLQS